MTPDQQFWLAMLVQVGVIITGVAAIWMKVNGVHQQINGRMSELLDLTATSEHAKGVASMTPPPSTLASDKGS